MPPSLAESAFDTFHRNVEGYAGNPVFDVAMGHLKGFDWNTIDTNKAKQLAQNIGKSILDKGVGFVKDYAGKTVGTGIMALGMATGATETALVVAGAGMAVGAAIDWAIDFFTSEGWVSQDEGYSPGDWVAIDVSIGGTREAGPKEKEGLRRRRRLVKQGVNIGIVASRNQAGYVDVQNVQTGELRAVPVQQIAKLSDTVSGDLESNVDLKELHDYIGHTKRLGGAQLKVKTSTRNGDSVVYRGSTWRIQEARADDVIIESGGMQTQIGWDDEDLDDAWNKGSTWQPLPGRRDAGFVTQGGINSGDWVWFEDNAGKQLGVVFATKITMVIVVSALTGQQHTVDVEYVRPAQSFYGEIFARFRAEVADGNLEKAYSLAPGRIGGYSTAQACVDSFDPPEVPQEVFETPSRGKKRPLEDQTTNSRAKHMDYLNELDDRFGRRPDGDANPEEVGEEEEGGKPQNNNVFLYLGAAAILAYCLVR